LSPSSKEVLIITSISDQKVEVCDGTKVE